MRRLIFLVSLLIFAIEANGQDEEELFFEYDPVRITNPGSLYSEVDWTPEMKAELIAVVGEDHADLIIQGSSESNWPVGIASLNARVLNQNLMLEYEGYYLTTVNKSMAVIMILAKENRHMEKDMLPKEDFYLVILENAIEISDAEPIDWMQVFLEELEVITLDYKNGFINLLDEVIQEPNEDQEKIYSSKVTLEGAYYLTFFQDGASSDISLRGVFLGDSDPESALIIYQGLVYQVENIDLSCCTLVKKEETARGNTRSQDFEVAAKNGYLDPDFQNMVINLTLEPSEIFNRKGDLENHWEPVMYIFKK